MRRYAFALAYLYPLSVVAGYAMGGPALFLTMLGSFVVHPLLDALAGVDDAPRRDARDDGGLVPRLLLWLYVPVQVGLVAWAVFAVTHRPLTTLELIGFTYAVGLTSGTIGFTIAHELVHRPHRAERCLGLVVLATVSYMHFRIEHVLGHHRRVATPDDPATARLGESVYAFIPRAVIGGVRGAWRLERRRLAHRGTAAGFVENHVLRYAAIQAAVAAAVLAWSGAAGLAFFLAQGAIAVIVLESVNYIEHYGLVRRRVAPGRYEPVTVRHSWNTSHRLTNWYLFNLGRHADHHVFPGRRYGELRHAGESPQLPAGYFAMGVLSLAPPLWRRVMDPRVRAWRTPA